MTPTGFETQLFEFDMPVLFNLVLRTIQERHPKHNVKDNLRFDLIMFTSIGQYHEDIMVKGFTM